MTWKVSSVCWKPCVRCSTDRRCDFWNQDDFAIDDPWLFKVGFSVMRQKAISCELSGSRDRRVERFMKLARSAEISIRPPQRQEQLAARPLFQRQLGAGPLEQRGGFFVCALRPRVLRGGHPPLGNLDAWPRRRRRQRMVGAGRSPPRLARADARTEGLGYIGMQDDPALGR